MKSRTIAIAALLLAVGCSNKEKQASQAAAAKSAEAAEIDRRAKAVAEDLIRKAEADAEKKREADMRQKADALKQLRQNVIDRPGEFIETGKLQMDARQHLTSVALTNKSKFSISDVHGTVDYHGAGFTDDVVARVPVRLSGSIAPGGSMIFSEQQHTLSGASIQLAKTPSHVTFTITSATVGSEGLDSTPELTGADAGAGFGG